MFSLRRPTWIAHIKFFDIIHKPANGIGVHIFKWYYDPVFQNFDPGEVATLDSREKEYSTLRSSQSLPEFAIFNPDSIRGHTIEKHVSGFSKTVTGTGKILQARIDWK